MYFPFALESAVAMFRLPYSASQVVVKMHLNFCGFISTEASARWPATALGHGKPFKTVCKSDGYPIHSAKATVLMK